jgi:SAM-dependent methyltransferase
MTKDNSFFPTKISKKNIDTFVMRNSILNAITFAMPQLKGELLDIGCGKMPYRKWILENSKVESYVGLDIENALLYDQTVKPDFTWGGEQMPFGNEEFDCAFGTEVLEHCPNPEVILKETFRVLKLGGVFFFTVPFLWNLHEVPNDEYRYTPFSLRRHLLNSGFEQVEIYAHGGWHLSMAQMLGLWAKRSYVPHSKRKLIMWILPIIIKKLIALSKFEKVEFKEGQMISGLYGIARK